MRSTCLHPESRRTVNEAFESVEMYSLSFKQFSFHYLKRFEAKLNIIILYECISLQCE